MPTVEAIERINTPMVAVIAGDPLGLELDLVSLRGDGYTVRGHSSFVEAIEGITLDKPDIVVMDLDMPCVPSEANGLAFARMAIRIDKGAMIIAQADNPEDLDPSDMMVLREAGIREVVPKDNIDVLRETISRIRNPHDYPELVH